MYRFHGQVLLLAHMYIIACYSKKLYNHTRLPSKLRENADIKDKKRDREYRREENEEFG